MFAETLSDVEVESLASTLEWNFPFISDKRKFVEGDVTTLDVIGQEFPLLDREAELKLVIDTMKEIFNSTGIEPERNRIQYCFGGVSGSGKTRFAREIAPHFNAEMEGEMRALFCRVNCRLLGNNIADANMAVVTSLLRESNVGNVGNADRISEKLRKTYNPLLFLLKIIGTKFKDGKTIIIVNLDEAQNLSPKFLLYVIAEINRANSSGPSHVHAWTLPTGLDLHQFNDIQTQSNTRVVVKVLVPVRNFFVP
jgi:Cdc6-like AAA superfamily ATPase